MSALPAMNPDHCFELEMFEKTLIAEIRPQDAHELDALREFRDAAWRLRQIRKNETARSHRAAAELSLHRSFHALRDMQSLRFGSPIDRVQRPEFDGGHGIAEAG